MKVMVNNTICTTEEEIRNALKWENQKGEYATIEYPETQPLYDGNIKIYGLEYNGKVYNIPQNFTARNGYNEVDECMTPHPNGGRCYSKELSYKYNCKEIIAQIKADFDKMGVVLG